MCHSLTPRSSPHRLSLLNSTVTSLAKSIGECSRLRLSTFTGTRAATRRSSLITAPLAATEEVVALYQAGLAPVEVAVLAVLHAIGATKEEIDEAVKKAVAEKERLTDNEQTTADHDATSREKEHAAKDQERKANEQRIVVEIEGAKAAVEAPTRGDGGDQEGRQGRRAAEEEGQGVSCGNGRGRGKADLGS